MYQLIINRPEETALTLKLTLEQLSQEMQLIATIKLYELGRLFSRAAANLLGIPKPLFLTKLADYGVETFQLTEAELAEELKSA
ncbi:MAG: UPF0175 family protein [Okeania sp. SIO2C2]|uniref:UPF0175 family protein n=1 Tax=Okeania sp. SIO2C2 TaxID=2607787 RepID=UPI0013BD6809|nr:UPF0175 family protein [Okeania sp. SIO2C2]NEP87533.1 UPF0175 family protein [Okeania sp. SIO2C2]